MKEVRYIKNFIDLEEEYMKNYNPYLIEESLLNSLSKRELKDLIKETNNSYLRYKLPYSYNLSRKQFKQGYGDLSKLDRCFVEQLEYFFNGGEELDKTDNFLERLKRFYKLNFETHNNYKNLKSFNSASIPIVEVLKIYMKLPYNLNKNCKCPLHKEKTGSFRIYKNTNSYFCFGCRSGGDSVKFVSEIENITNKEAYKKLAKIFNNY